MALITHSRSSRRAELIEAIRRSPGATKQQIVAAAGVHPSTAEKGLKTLLNLGVITRERETRTPESRVKTRWLYRLADSASPA